MSEHDSMQPRAGKRLIQRKSMRAKFDGASDMWLYRHRDKLPTPILIGGRRFWREDEVDAFIEKLSATRKADETKCNTIAQ